MIRLFNCILICIGLQLSYSCSKSNSQENFSSGSKIGEVEIVRKAEKINGVSFVSPPKPIEQSLMDIPKQKTGANYVSIMPYGFIDNESTELIYNSKWQWWGEKVDGASSLINMAQASGYRVMLKPQVWKRHGVYTGEHSYENESDWLAFEKSYAKFITHFAKVADSLNVEIFAIGTEWKNFVMERPQFWTQLIKEVKKIYKGDLTYASNWDEYSKVPFWTEMDFIGIDAYFPLVDTQTPSSKEVFNALKPIKNQLSGFSDSLNKKILFTEYGFRSRDYNAKRPWESDRVGEVNLIAQENAYHGFYDAFWSSDFVAGGFIWKWFANYPEAGGQQHNGFSPQNKPVEKTILEYYK